MKNKTYGILSLNVYQIDNNWGSILQSWALQKVLNQMNIEALIVNYRPEHVGKFNAKYPIVNKLPFHIKTLIRELRNDIHDWNDYIERDDKFKAFINKYYSLTEYYTSKTIPELDLDGYIVGSDIVWHIPFWGGFEKAFFCCYKNMVNKNNIAYAPSMADEPFSPNNEKTFQNYLHNFSHISVREASKREYVQSFTEKPVSVVLDPTLLLTEEDYNKFILKNFPHKDYILLYTVEQDLKLVSYVENYARKTGKKIIRLKCCGPDLLNKDWITYNNAGIEEWLTLIYNADVIFTNSFHCCIFSIIFKKRFFSSYREFGKLKILDLLKSFELRNYTDIKGHYTFDENLEFDYDYVYEKLNKYREQSIKYLFESLK